MVGGVLLVVALAVVGTAPAPTYEKTPVTPLTVFIEAASQWEEVPPAVVVTPDPADVPVMEELPIPDDVTAPVPAPAPAPPVPFTEDGGTLAVWEDCKPPNVIDPATSACYTPEGEADPEGSGWGPWEEWDEETMKDW